MSSTVEIKPGTGVKITRNDGELMTLRVVAFDGSWIAGKDKYGVLNYIPMTSIGLVTKLTAEEAKDVQISYW